MASVQISMRLRNMWRPTFELLRDQPDNSTGWMGYRDIRMHVHNANRCTQVALCMMRIVDINLRLSPLCQLHGVIAIFIAYLI